MSPEKRIFTQHEVYTPNITPIRNLGTTVVQNETITQKNSGISNSKTEEKNNKETVYLTFSLLSQIGGFCYFLKLIFGSFISVFMENIQAVELINSIKTKRQSATVESKVNLYESIKIEAQPEEENKFSIEY